MPAIHSTAGVSVTIAWSGGCTRAAASARSTRSASLSTAAWSGSASVRVRPTHSSPSGGSTSRASERRASDTTLANVASRTSCSQSAVRAFARVGAVAVGGQPGDELARLRALELDRCAAGVDHVDRAEQPHEQLPCRRLGGLVDPADGAPALGGDGVLGHVVLLVGRVDWMVSSPSGATTSTAAIGLAVGLVHGVVVGRRPGDGSSLAGIAGTDGGTLDQIGDRVDLDGAQPDRPEPQPERPQHPRAVLGRQPARRALDRRRRHDRQPGAVARWAHRRRPTTTRAAPPPAPTSRPTSHGHAVRTWTRSSTRWRRSPSPRSRTPTPGRLPCGAGDGRGTRRAGTPADTSVVTSASADPASGDGDRRDDRVGVRRRARRSRSPRAPRDRRRRRGRRSSTPSCTSVGHGAPTWRAVGAEQLDRRGGRDAPAVAGADPRRGQHGRPVGDQLELAVGCTRHGEHPPATVDQRQRRRPDGDVDAGQPLGRVDRPERAFGRRLRWRRQRQPCPRERRTELLTAARREQGEHAGRQHRGPAHAHEPGDAVSIVGR